jgi:hypothetical protein
MDDLDVAADVASEAGHSCGGAVTPLWRADRAKAETSQLWEALRQPTSAMPNREADNAIGRGAPAIAARPSQGGEASVCLLANDPRRGLVARRVPLRVEYSLTPRGCCLSSRLMATCEGPADDGSARRTGQLRLAA